MTEEKYDLERFVAAQTGDDGSYEDALAEIQNGRKRSHWIWYIFPQLKGLGNSYRSAYYGISGLPEAQAYLGHPILGQRLREITLALFNLQGVTARQVLGNIDAVKVRSCMTLFDAVSPNDIFAQVLEKYYAGTRCRRTMNSLKAIEDQPF